MIKFTKTANHFDHMSDNCTIEISTEGLELCDIDEAFVKFLKAIGYTAVSYTHLRAHET